jgi:RNA polymerase sigma factor (sigma-70 family)
VTRDQTLLSSATESSVVALAMAGDNKAFEELVRRRQGAVRRLMRQMSGDSIVADDLAQEAFVQTWLKLPTLCAPAAFGGWLRQIAVNVFLRHVRRIDPIAEYSDEIESGPAVNCGDPSTQMDLENALARLRPVEGLCVVLAYAERMSHGEICSARGLPLGTVKSHIMRGSERLRQYLSDYDGAQ